MVRGETDGNGEAEVLGYTDYYPFGWEMPGRQNTAWHRYAYQGIEKDHETGWSAFTLRMYDGRVGRWAAPDPMGQFYSPYLAMGNDPVGMVDPSGGVSFEFDMGQMMTSLFSMGASLAAAHGSWKQGLIGQQQKSAFNPSFWSSDAFQWGLGVGGALANTLGGGGQVVDSDGNLGHDAQSSLDEVTIVAGGPRTIYDKFNQVRTRRELGLPMDGGMGDWSRSYDSYLTGRFSPAPLPADAITVSAETSGVFGGGKTITVGYTTTGHGDLRPTIDPGGGVGLDVGAGVSVTFHNYVGEGRPDLSSLQGLTLNNQVNLGPVSIEYSQDMTKIIGSTQRGLQAYDIGTKWRSLKIGLGLYAPSPIGVPISGSTTFSHTIIK